MLDGRKMPNVTGLSSIVTPFTWHDKLSNVSSQQLCSLRVSLKSSNKLDCELVNFANTTSNRFHLGLIIGVLLLFL